MMHNKEFCSVTFTLISISFLSYTSHVSYYQVGLHNLEKNFISGCVPTIVGQS